MFASVVNFIAALIFSKVTVPLTVASLVLHGSFVSLSSFAIHVAAESIALIERFITFLSSLALADTPIVASGLSSLLVLPTALWVLLPAWLASCVGWSY